MKNESGVLLFDTVFVISVFFFGVFWGHVEIVKLWRQKIEKLQIERIAYDGEKVW